MIGNTFLVRSAAKSTLSFPIWLDPPYPNPIQSNHPCVFPEGMCAIYRVEHPPKRWAESNRLVWGTPATPAISLLRHPSSWEKGAALCSWHASQRLQLLGVLVVILPVLGLQSELQRHHLAAKGPKQSPKRTDKSTPLGLRQDTTWHICHQCTQPLWPWGKQGHSFLGSLSLKRTPAKKKGTTGGLGAAYLTNPPPSPGAGWCCSAPDPKMRQTTSTRSRPP